MTSDLKRVFAFETFTYQAPTKTGRMVTRLVTRGLIYNLPASVVAAQSSVSPGSVLSVDEHDQPIPYEPTPAAPVVDVEIEGPATSFVDVDITEQED